MGKTFIFYVASLQNVDFPCSIWVILMLCVVYSIVTDVLLLCFPLFSDNTLICVWNVYRRLLSMGCVSKMSAMLCNMLILVLM